MNTGQLHYLFSILPNHVSLTFVVVASQNLKNYKGFHKRKKTPIHETSSAHCECGSGTFLIASRMNHRSSFKGSKEGDIVSSKVVGVIEIIQFIENYCVWWGGCDGPWNFVVKAASFRVSGWHAVASYRPNGGGIPPRMMMKDGRKLALSTTYSIQVGWVCDFSADIWKDIWMQRPLVTLVLQCSLIFSCQVCRPTLSESRYPIIDKSRSTLIYFSSSVPTLVKGLIEVESSMNSALRSQRSNHTQTRTYN